jgi:DNA (cytosine-5)-methyltransferase 1
MAGSRNPADPRNLLFKAYIEFVELVQPRYVLIENVHGITVEHGRKSRKVRRSPGRRPLAYSERITLALKRIGYLFPQQETVSASAFGVPQRRPRVFFFAERTPDGGRDTSVDFFKELYKSRRRFLTAKRLPIDREVHVQEAISDLLERHGRVPCCDPESPSGFWQGVYGSPEYDFQRLLRNGHRAGQAADSHRFVNHRDETRNRFQRIRASFRSGVSLSADERATLDMAKHVVVPLRGDQVGHTLTTLPDDYVHYCEPRILTPREYARLQTFPDSFILRGKYTTGGDRRKRECPRYTQIGNAVPPLLAEAIGRTLRRIARQPNARSFEAAP